MTTLLSREDARYDSEITIMRLGEVERMCIQSRVGEDRMAARGIENTMGNGRRSRKGREEGKSSRVNIDAEKERKGGQRCNKVFHGRRKERP